MPKSTKKKKDKAADFTKAKLKLGKGKQTPSNVIDTSFKARSIALPTQTISTDQDAQVPTTKRRLTFEALVGHIKHYNAGTRRDAILGLRELLEAHPQLITTSLTTLMSSCVRLIGDEDASVRKSLLSLFAWLFRQLPPDEIIPHSPVLLLFTTSAQTHIFPEIRIDAVRFLDIYLEHIPNVVTEGWARSGSMSHGRRVLEGYLGILNAGTTFGDGGDVGPIRATSTASVVLSPASKLVVMNSLASFLHHAVQPSWHARGSDPSSSTDTTPTWYLSSSFSSRSAFSNFDTLICPSSGVSTSISRRAWHEDAALDSEDFVGDYPSFSGPSVSAWSLNDLADVASALLHDDAGSDNDAEISCVTHLAKTLHATLVSTYVDNAPSVFSPGSTPPETESNMISVVCRICRCLYGRILQDAAESGSPYESAAADLQAMLSYLSVYFPFTFSGGPTSTRDVKIEQAFQDLNLIFCELSSLLVLATQRSDSRDPLPRHSQPSKPRRSRTLSTAQSHTPDSQIEHVRVYVGQLLKGQGQSPNQSSIPRPITPHAYTALLPTIWSLINSQTEYSADASDSVTSIIIEHATKSSSTSAVKKHTIDFVGRLVLLGREPEYFGSFEIERLPDNDAKLRGWLLQLPRTLWELGNTRLHSSETIVRILLRLFQRRSQLLTPGTIAALRTRLVPYFVIVHQSRGKLPGPYTKLTATTPLRRLVLDLVATVIGPDTRTDDGIDELKAAVLEATQNTTEQKYWSAIVSSMRL